MTIIRPNYKNTKGGIFYNCISGLISQTLQAKIHLYCRKYGMPEIIAWNPYKVKKNDDK